MKRVPLVKLSFKDLSNTSLVTYANKHRLAIAVNPGLTNFPDVIFDAAALATLITTYRLSLATAYKGTKTDTDAKNDAKENLVQALQQNWNYINQTLQGSAGQYLGYGQLRAFASTSGFDVTNTTRPAGPLGAPMIRSITSPEIGQMKIILNKFSKSGKQRTKKIRGAKVYKIYYRTSAVPGTVPVPAGPWVTEVSSAYFWQKSELASGSYDVYVVAQGANQEQSAPTTTRQIVVL